MRMTIEPSGQACGAIIRDVDLSGRLDPDLISAIKNVWAQHHVLAFVDQKMDDDALERFTMAMGGFGSDPFFQPIEGRSHIAAIMREADETTPLFAENWHSDWSFLAIPPIGTCLLAIDIPPHGGDTLFSNQAAVFSALPEERKEQLRELTAIHSAVRGYAPDGVYGDSDKGRSMAIRSGEEAYETQEHPLVIRHPVTGQEMLFASPGYVIGIKELAEPEANALLFELAEWQQREEFLYRHKWQDGMLVMWDNRAVTHRATGGYDGYRRELHRTTIAGRQFA